MNFLKDIFLGAIKGILSLGIALIMLLIFFSILGTLFSPDSEEEVVVSDNSLLYIDNLSLIGDRDTKADELDFNFEIPLPLPLIDNSQTEKIINMYTYTCNAKTKRKSRQYKTTSIYIQESSLT